MGSFDAKVRLEGADGLGRELRHAATEAARELGRVLPMTLGEIAMAALKSFSVRHSPTGKLRESWEIRQVHETPEESVVEVGSSMEDSECGEVILRSLEHGHKAYDVTPLLERYQDFGGKSFGVFRRTPANPLCYDEPGRFWLRFSSKRGREVFTKKARIPAAPGLHMLVKAEQTIEARIDLIAAAALERMAATMAGIGQ